MIKKGGRELKKVIYDLILKMWEEEWKCGIICPIHRKGGMMMCDNYSAVILLRTT
jgi:hypothetical protein